MIEISLEKYTELVKNEKMLEIVRSIADDARMYDTENMKMTLAMIKGLLCEEGKDA